MTVLRSLQRLGSVTACVAAAVAIAAPIAQADPWGIDANPSASATLRCSQLDPWAYHLVCGEARSERSATRSASSVTSAGSPASQVVRSTGFDWRDASIGAATTLGLLLLLGVAATVALRRRRTVAHVSS